MQGAVKVSRWKPVVGAVKATRYLPFDGAKRAADGGAHGLVDALEDAERRQLEQRERHEDEVGLGTCKERHRAGELS